MIISIIDALKYDSRKKGKGLCCWKSADDQIIHLEVAVELLRDPKDRNIMSVKAVIAEPYCTTDHLHVPGTTGLDHL